MKKQEIMAIALKILGVVAFMHAISTSQLVFVFIPQIGIGQQPMTMSLWLSLACMLIPIVLMLLAGVILVTRGERLASKWFPSESTSSSPQWTISAKELQALAFSVLGVYLFLTALPNLAALGMDLFTASSVRLPDTGRVVAHRYWHTGIYGAVQAILGVLLFLRARSLAKLWHIVRGE